MNVKQITITVIILTYNEEKNISFSVSNVIDWADEVIVLDSYSTDSTVQIAEDLRAKVFFRKFDNYAKQRNYALDELPISGDWILFLDADEYLTEELKEEILQVLPTSNYDGFYLKRRFIFMGKWIKHGGYYPTKLLRLFRKGKCRVEREINEQLIVNGKTSELKYDFIDHNRKDISDWVSKHNRYSSMEAEQLIEYEKRKMDNISDEYAKLFGTSPQRKRWIRENIWNRFLTPLTRPFIYFFYRYFLRFGFLDGKAGFIYFFLHAFLMEFLTNVKYIEKKAS